MFTTIKLLKLILDKKDSQKVANILLENELILATAESCTGGLISSLMTDIPGSSSFIKSNFVTYANEAKTKSDIANAKYVVDRTDVPMDFS